MAIEDYYGPLLVCSPVPGSDVYGSASVEYGPEREVLGYIGRPSSRQAVVMGQRGVDVDGRLYAPLEAGVREFDVIREKGSEQRFQIVGEPRDAAKRGHHIEADLRKWRG